MRRHGFAWFEAVIIVAILGVVAAILVPVVRHSRKNAKSSSCDSNLKQIGLGFLQYTQDYGDELPPVTLGEKEGWSEAVWPYIRSWQTFQCSFAQKNHDRTTDYFYNARVEKMRLKTFLAPSFTILAGDGRDDSPLNYALAELPQSWCSDWGSPIWRHYNWANYLFVDGHVKWLKPDAVTVEKPKGTSFTFAVR